MRPLCSFHDRFRDAVVVTGPECPQYSYADLAMKLGCRVAFQDGIWFNRIGDYTATRPCKPPSSPIEPYAQNLILLHRAPKAPGIPSGPSVPEYALLLDSPLQLHHRSKGAHRFDPAVFLFSIFFS